MKTETMDYQKQATDFLESAGITFECEFLRHGSMHWDTKGTTRDIYTLVLRRDRDYIGVEFGNSIVNSGFYYTKGKMSVPIERKYLELPKDKIVSMIKRQDYDFLNNGKSDVIHYPIAPTAYDLLASITKYNPGTFDDFCSEYGYSNDSISAEEAWQAVREEWSDVRSFFTKDELEQLQEIQ